MEYNEKKPLRKHHARSRTQDLLTERCAARRLLHLARPGRGAALDRALDLMIDMLEAELRDTRRTTDDAATLVEVNVSNDGAHESFIGGHVHSLDPVTALAIAADCAEEHGLLTPLLRLSPHV